MNSLDQLKKDLLDVEVVKEYLRLKDLVLKDKNLSAKLERFQEIKKQMVNAKELGLTNCYNEYQKEYNEIKDSFENDVLMNMYFNAKEEVKSFLDELTSAISFELSKEII